MTYLYPLFGDPNKTYARVVASTTYQGRTIWTVEVNLHRFVLAELNTHRAISKNSASSRAIPVHKTLGFPTALPVSVPGKQRGMQGGEELTGQDLKFFLEEVQHLREEIHLFVGQWKDKVHKSVLNRYLEPFLYHRVILTSSYWENFFAQRCSPLAQPEIRLAAEYIREAIQNVEPVESMDHLPYVNAEEVEDIEAAFAHIKDRFPSKLWNYSNYLISMARCARVSYLTHEGKRDLGKDFDLAERLLNAKPIHASPGEHQALMSHDGKPDIKFHRNLAPGVRQFRSIVEDSIGVDTLRT